MAIDEGRDQFAEQEFEAERRRDREADYAPASFGARRVLSVPVLLGGYGDGLPWDTRLAHVKVGLPAGGVEIYRLRKWTMGGARLAVRFCAWEGLSEQAAAVAMWEWLVLTVLDPGAVDRRSMAQITQDETDSIDAAEAEHERKVEAIVRVLQGPPVPYRELAESLLATVEGRRGSLEEAAAQVPIRAEDFESPLTEDEQRRADAIESVLRRKLPALPYLTDEWIRELAESCLAAADAPF